MGRPPRLAGASVRRRRHKPSSKEAPVRWPPRRIDADVHWNERHAFDKRRKRFTGLATRRDYNDFFGYALEEVAKMPFTEMEQLPGVVKHTIIGLGGSYLLAHKLYHWRRMVKEKGRLLRRGEEGHGRGESYNEAAFSGSDGDEMLGSSHGKAS